jgi:hypothetical protein
MKQIAAGTRTLPGCAARGGTTRISHRGKNHLRDAAGILWGRTNRH